MARSRTVSHSAYVIHMRPYRETSVMLDLFTRDQGRLSAIYRGGRKTAGSSARSKPELFSHYHLGLFGNGELKTVSHLELDVQFAAQRLQGVQLFSGLYVNEILYKTVHSGVAHTDIFAAYEDLLLALRNTSNFEAHLRHFELKLLASLGYGLSFEQEAESHQPIDVNLNYEFVAGLGFRLAARLANDKGFVCSGALIKKMAEGHWQDEQVLQCLKQVNQRALTVILKGKPVKSREFLRKSRVDNTSPNSALK